MKYLIILFFKITLITSMFSQDFYELSGYTIFYRDSMIVPNTNLAIRSYDLKVDTSVTSNNQGFFNIHLPTGEYSIIESFNSSLDSIINDSLIGTSGIILKNDTVVSLKLYYNFNHDYKVFKNGFSKIYEGPTIIGFTDDFSFSRTQFIGIYAAYSIIENGIYEVRGDTIITKITSINSYISGDKLEQIGRLDYYIKNEDSSDLIMDIQDKEYDLIDFRTLNENKRKEIEEYYDSYKDIIRTPNTR